ncbi:inter-alpha-trypsin inhibitor heavy chain h3 [Plakobranchus ocellatus]|uniref:Inter-alpha-trypsin inhibitor heavy chain h3 n=1 Tax=Plakobranchus ocellatus TaxID=259542 RepID=A0AAV4DH15_9GAST|nr:inter-alpha-trypsin inhibitor heavy chain h3 [Plakobranchus ocellatus]
MVAKSVWAFTVMVSMVTALTSDEASLNKRVETFHVNSDILFRSAITKISSRIRNLDNVTQEIKFSLAKPKAALIIAFYITIDGQRYNGKITGLQTTESENQADQISGQTMIHTPRNADLFEVSVNVPAGSAATFTLIYQEMLRRRRGFYEYKIHVNPGQSVPDFFIEVKILENRPLTFVRVPELRTDDLITNCLDETDEENINELAIVKRTGPETATVLYRPNESQQGATGISAAFVIHYEMEHGEFGDVIMFDNYFAHFIVFDRPSQFLPKDIIFVLDQSGSMKGRKIRQLKRAMGAILSDLLPQDRFNIIKFNSSPAKWKTSLIQANANEIDQSKVYVNKIGARGHTNINDALLTALSDFTGEDDGERVRIIFFLTDGKPTMGGKDPGTITQNIVDANDRDVAIYCLGFGKDADFGLLRTLCAQNRGFTTEIYEACDAAEQVSCLYDRISDVSATNVHIDYKNSVDGSTLTQTDFPMVFNGTEITVFGRLNEGVKTMKYEITASEKSGKLNISVEMGDINTVELKPLEAINPFLNGPQFHSGIIERMWAYTKITENLMEKDKYTPDNNKTEKLLKDVFLKSLKYSFVTPLTSLVVDGLDQGNLQVRKINMNDEIFNYAMFNFTVPPSPTTVVPVTSTNIPPNPLTRSQAAHTCVISFPIILLVLLFKL